MHLNAWDWEFWDFVSQRVCDVTVPGCGCPAPRLQSPLVHSDNWEFAQAYSLIHCQKLSKYKTKKKAKKIKKRQKSFHKAFSVFQAQLSPSLPSPVDEVLQLSVQVLDGKPQIERDYTLRQRLKSRCPRRPRCPRPKPWLRKDMSHPVTAINTYKSNNV